MFGKFNFYSELLMRWMVLIELPTAPLHFFNVPQGVSRNTVLDSTADLKYKFLSNLLILELVTNKNSHPSNLT